MSTPSYVYRIGDALPPVELEWLAGATGAVIDFSTGWTFTASIAAATAPGTVLATITTGITGAATSPNVTIDWATDAFDTLTPAAAGTVYVVHLVAIRTSDSKPRRFSPKNPPRIEVLPALA